MDPYLIIWRRRRRGSFRSAVGMGPNPHPMEKWRETQQKQIIINQVKWREKTAEENRLSSKWLGEQITLNNRQICCCWFEFTFEVWDVVSLHNCLKPGWTLQRPLDIFWKGSARNSPRHVTQNESCINKLILNKADNKQTNCHIVKCRMSFLDDVHCPSLPYRKKELKTFQMSSGLTVTVFMNRTCRHVSRLNLCDRTFEFVQVGELAVFWCSVKMSPEVWPFLSGV